MRPCRRLRSRGRSVATLITLVRCAKAAAEDVALPITNSTYIPPRQYPQDALRCYATAAESPPRRIVCPEDRSDYCVKEVANASRRDCGTSFDYNMDEWDVKLGQCVYRKCASICSEEKNITFFGPRGSYERATYCCNKELCNSAVTRGMSFCVAVFAGLLVIMLGHLET